MAVAHEYGADRVCLCILFNHPFAANIPLLRALYSDRFPLIRFLLPFEHLPDEDVLTVYRGSFAHSSFANDHLSALQATGATHFVFLQDDVLLSPYLNAGNIVATLGLDRPKSGYVGQIGPAEPRVTEWGFQIGSLWRLLYPRNYLAGTGVDSLSTILRYLPPVDIAARKAAAIGVPAVTRFILPEDGFPDPLPAAFHYFGRPLDDDRALVSLLARQLFAGTDGAIELPYPIAMAGPFADFYAISADVLPMFAHVNAMLGTAGLFVEMAMATALMLACDTIATDASLERRQMFAPAFVPPRAALAELYADPGLTSVHPVKLSQIDDPRSFAASSEPMSTVARALARRDFRSAVLDEFPDFDAATYLGIHDDLAHSGAEPFEHFYRFGLHERRAWRAEPVVA